MPSKTKSPPHAPPGRMEPEVAAGDRAALPGTNHPVSSVREKEEASSAALGRPGKHSDQLSPRSTVLLFIYSFKFGKFCDILHYGVNYMFYDWIPFCIMGI